MALTVANNVSSLAAQLSLSQSTSALSSSLQKLSTGLKINQGADGPAALVISEQQRAQIAGLQQAIDNTSTAVSLVQTGEGALNEVSALLTQARGLALNSANTGVNDQNALDANQSQLSNILSTIDNIANTTQFGQKKLLNGSAGLVVTSAPSGYSLNTTGATAGGTYTLSGFTAATRANSLGGAYVGVVDGTSDATLNINGVNIALNTANAGGGSAAVALANVVQTVNSYSAQTGVKAVANAGKLQLISNSFGSTGNFTATASGANAAALLTAIGYAGNVVTATATNGTAATNVAGTLTDANANVFAGVGSGNVLSFTSGGASGLSVTFGASGNTSTVGANADVVKFNNNSLTFQIGANAGQTASVAFNSANTTSLGLNTQNLTNVAFTSLSTVKINTTAADAQDALRVIDKAIQDVTNQRGTLGAFQANTLQANSQNLQAALQNTTSAESTIRDTDYASEISNFTKLQVQLQAGASVLGNANQLPAIVTQLLQKL